ncbi:hypothetical protein NDU88_003271 [Pleurodeles waltl]|uniref:Uncharacterized protein n=1 Tax=Pleurodeles waltl TaxID=8319 RepID=A0AAV7M5Q1_PLEWA|nr:hypothetical protein NDU88_003271 [Pleurodeles waltl]
MGPPTQLYQRPVLKHQLPLPTLLSGYIWSFRKDAWMPKNRKTIPVPPSVTGENAGEDLDNHDGDKGDELGPSRPREPDGGAKGVRLDDAEDEGDKDTSVPGMLNPKDIYHPCSTDWVPM